MTPVPHRPARRRRRDRLASRSGRDGRLAVVLLVTALGLLLAAWIAATIYSLPRTSGTQVRYDEFLSDLRQGRIQSVTVLVADRRLTGQYDGGTFWLDYGESDLSPLFVSAADALSRTAVPVQVDQQPLKQLVKGTTVTAVLPALLVAGVLMLSYLLSRGTGGFGRSGSRRVGAGESTIRFADVAGNGEAVEELREIRDFLADPSRFLALGARPPRGVLLVGPPGCGKTLLARAVAGECDAHFFSVSGSSFVEMYAGVGAARIRDLFREAARAAPAIVFIDELDAVGRGRSPGGATDQAERESSLNQLLVSMDGFDGDSGVVVIAATNRPDVLDPALLRRGRFDRHVTVDTPDRGGRVGILGVHARGVRMATDADLEELARRTAGFNGADLAAVVNEAALLAARRGEGEVSGALLREAMERIVAGPERRSRLLSVREKEVVAFHEAGHALVSATVGGGERIVKISLVARGRAGGMTWVNSADEGRMASKSQLCDRLATLMGGRAAEELVLGEPMSAAEDDLHRATDLARRMVCELGMSERLGPLSLKVTVAQLQSEIQWQASPDLGALVDAEVRHLLEKAQATARRVLEDREPVLHRLATTLIEVETLEGPVLDELLFHPRGTPTSPPDGAPAEPGPRAAPGPDPTAYADRESDAGAGFAIPASADQPDPAAVP